MMTEGQRIWIINASYYELLKRWRFAEGRDDIFHGESGQFYSDTMNYKKEQLSLNECVRISKLIGWVK